MIFPTPNFRGGRGFSLIEVALALALTAVALLGVLSMLPPGLKMFRASMDATVATQISQRLISEAGETDFDQLLPAEDEPTTAGYFALPRRYFDEQGQELPVKDPEHPTAAELRSAIYEVRSRGSRPGEADPGQHRMNFPTSLPAAESGNSPPYNPRELIGLTFQIAQNPAHRVLPDDSTNPLLWKVSEAGSSDGVPIYTYSAVVARNGSL